VYRIGIDVGGTFTDVVAVDAAGRVTLVKAASTPPDPSLGVLEGLRLLADTLGTDLPSLLGATDRLVHGTTVATNALIERKGARVGLLTTEGHRDVLEMREGLKEGRYNLRMPPPVPILDDARRSKENRLLGGPVNRPNSLFLAANPARRLRLTVRCSRAGEFPGHPFMQGTTAAPPAYQWATRRVQLSHCQSCGLPPTGSARGKVIHRVWW